MQKYRNQYFKPIFILILFLISTHCLAFKPNTHVFVAQKVIDDLADGRVSIAGKTYIVDTDIVNAIRENPEIYRMGHIGPDAAPDIYAGQMVIHPGTVTFGTDQWAIALNEYVNNLSKQYSVDDWYAWKDDICESQDYDLDEVWDYLNNLSEEEDYTTTGEYLNEADEIGLMDAFAQAIHNKEVTPPSLPGKANPEYIAYEKGFLGHIAGDTFAHSYVNQYAGDVFSLTNGEIETEKRHAAIEVYIDEKLPALAQGHPYQLIHSPSKFIANAFILNKDLARYFSIHQSKVTGKNRSGMADHLYAMGQFRRGVRNAASSCAWTAMDRFAMQIAVEYLTGYVPNENQIAALNNLQDSVHGFTGDVKDEYHELKDDLNEIITDAHRKHFARLDKHVTEIENGIEELNQIERDILDAKDAIVEEGLDLGCLVEEGILDMDNDCPPLDFACEVLMDEIDVPTPHDLGFPTPGEILDDIGVPPPACVMGSIYQEKVRLRDRLLEERDRQVSSMIDATRDNLEDLKTAIIEIHELMDAVNATMHKISTISRDINPFRKALRDWDEQILQAITAWVEANAQVIRISMQRAVEPPSSIEDHCFKFGGSLTDCFNDQETLQPIKNWINIYGPVFTGVPIEVSTLGNQTTEVIDSVSNLVGGIQRTHILAALDPIARMEFLDLEESLSHELEGADPIDLILKVAGNDGWSKIYHDIRTLFAVRMDRASIDEMFTKDDANLGLLTFKDEPFTRIMDKDMGLSPGSNAKMDWQQFPALANAVTLAKLSLLNSKELSHVARDLGIPANIYVYSDLYPTPICVELPPEAQAHTGEKERCYNQHTSNLNVIYHAIRNIDGYQAWKPKADPLPRVGNSFANAFAMQDNDPEYPPLTYGYNKQGDHSGFRFWYAGEQYFNKLFKFPLFADPISAGDSTGGDSTGDNDPDPNAVPVIDSADIDSSGSQWSVNLFGQNLTSSLSLKIYDDDSVWFSNPQLRSLASGIAFDLPNTMPPSKCNVAKDCEIFVVANDADGNEAVVWVTLPSLEVNQPYLTNVSVNKNTQPWQVIITGENFTAGNRIDLYTSNNGPWKLNIATTLVNSGEVVFRLPANGDPNRCNMYEDCKVKFQLTDIYGQYIRSLVPLPSLTPPPAKIYNITVNKNNNPWRVNIYGEYFNPNTKVSFTDRNNSPWRSNITATYYNSTTVRVNLPSNMPPSHCNLSSTCSITVKVNNGIGATASSNLVLPSMGILPPSISQSGVYTSSKLWKAWVSGHHFTASTTVTLRKANGSVWKSNIATSKISNDRIEFYLPANQEPGGCNSNGTCRVQFSVVDGYGRSINSNLTLPSTAPPPTQLTSVSLYKNSTPWTVVIEGSNLTPKTKVSFFDTTGKQWGSEVYGYPSATNRITARLPANIPPSKCNLNSTCSILVKTKNESNIIYRYSNKYLTLPSLGIKPPTITKSGVTQSYQPWAPWMMGENLTEGTTVTVYKSNGAVWKSNIPTNLSDHGSITFRLPGNLEPNKCNAIKSCGVKVVVKNEYGQQTTSTLTLPAYDTHTPSISSSGVKQSPTHWTGWLAGENLSKDMKITIYDIHNTVWLSGMTLSNTAQGGVSFRFSDYAPPSYCNRRSYCTLRIVLKDKWGREASNGIRIPQTANP